MRHADDGTADGDAVLTGFGLVSAAGEDAEGAATTLAAGISEMREIGIPERGGDPLVGCPAIDLDGRHGHVRRLGDLAVRAAREALAQAGAVPATATATATATANESECHLFWILPLASRVGFKVDPTGPFRSEFLSAIGLARRRVEIHVLEAGPAAAVAALQTASAIVRARPSAICLVGGVDTLIQLRVLRWLQRNDRLRTEVWVDGLIPGEAAAFIVVEAGRGARARGARALCRFEGLGYEGVAEAPSLPDHARAQALSRVLKAALPCGDARGRIERVYGDLNGENLRALEWGIASLRVLDAAGIDAETIHPADGIGDVGAASCVMNIGLAAFWLRDRQPHTRAMVVAASESGERGALSIARTEDCPAPPVRQGTAPTPAYRRILTSHFEEAAFLWSLRQGRLDAVDSGLSALARVDRRLTAHTRGLILAGPMALDGIENDEAASGPGEVFTRALLAIEGSRFDRLGRLFDEVRGSPALHPALASAFGWVSAASLRGLAQRLLESERPLERWIGLAAIDMHRVDPKDLLDRAIGHDHLVVRARALRAAGDLGRSDLLQSCLRSLPDTDPYCRYEAARSALLLGNRDAAPEALIDLAGSTSKGAAGPGELGADALRWALLVLEGLDAQEALRRALQGGVDARALVRAVPYAGDVRYVPWLIEQSADSRLARVAVEALSLLLGLEVATFASDSPDAPKPDFGPGDDPTDDRVDMDPDEGLAWPDPPKLRAWWHAHQARYVAGVRYFMGVPLSGEHCRRVLASGLQRQRIAAAAHLALAHPGSVLFATSAPAWRQQRLLGIPGSALR
ncbi:conserved hypothetical protein [Burkholderiales bacterium 8X]|nr:conserved hypothetical protein [Burkholderiales bacterium 8X]